jgi:pyridoxal phosphate enzyme (YggS family)
MDGSEVTALRQAVGAVQERIAAAAARSGRRPADVTLVAVTKTQPVERIRQAYDLGLRDFGENRLEEAESKHTQLPADARWHMVGHIQSRKAARAVQPYRLVHSLDNLKLAVRLDRFASEAAAILSVLLEVNVSGEAAKYGFPPERIHDAVEQIMDLHHVRIQGLMAMAPVVPTAEAARPVFVALRVLRDSLTRSFPEVDWSHLSMGMSDDFEVAIEEGATIVRIGRAIFGEIH